jgi:hypothetical protein
MIYTIYPTSAGYTLRKGNVLRFCLTLDAARWHMLKDAISHGYTWVVVRYV